MLVRIVLMVAALRACDGFAVGQWRAAAPLRARPLTMGGPSGLPRISQRGLSLTKRFNPSCEYDLDIATLWRDLEITYGLPDAPSEDRAFRAAKRCPSLLNPQESSRWVFFRSKDLLTKATGSEQAAIDIMSKDPSLLLCDRYDGLNPKLERMLIDAGIDPKSVSAQGAGVSLQLLLAGVGLAVGAVAVAANGGF